MLVGKTALFSGKPKRLKRKCVLKLAGTEWGSKFEDNPSSEFPDRAGDVGHLDMTDIIQSSVYFTNRPTLRDSNRVWNETS